MRAEGEVRIDEESDIVSARQAVRQAAIELGFSTTDTTRIVTAASEMARNVFKYAGSGEMRWRVVTNGGARGLELHFVDRGPGIKDVDEALKPGFSTGGGLGLGLPGAQRLMDELEIDTAPDRGTTVRLTKWLGG